MLKIPQDVRTKIWMDKQNFTNILIDKMIKTDNTKIELLQKLMDKGYFIGCVTNSIRDTAEKMLKNSGLFDYIDLIIAGDEVKNQKPASEGYVTAMVKFESYPKETYIVEDSEYGKHSAYATGSNVIVVKNDSEVTIELFQERGLL
jgi:HAD superfamily hydrolase (TIGR01509 family)